MARKTPAAKRLPRERKVALRPMAVTGRSHHGPSAVTRPKRGSHGRETFNCALRSKIASDRSWRTGEEKGGGKSRHRDPDVHSRSAVTAALKPALRFGRRWGLVPMRRRSLGFSMRSFASEGLMPAATGPRRSRNTTAVVRPGGGRQSPRKAKPCGSGERRVRKQRGSFDRPAWIAPLLPPVHPWSAGGMRELL